MQNLCIYLPALLSSHLGEMKREPGKPKLCSQSGIATHLKNLVPQQAVRIMKITAIILLAACLQVQAAGYGQKVTLALKDAPLEKLFTEIKKQTGYKFLYINKQVQNAQKITIQVKDASVEDVLEQCLREQPFGYEIKERTIVIIPKSSKSGPLQRNLLPPPLKEVRGIITDENGVPLQGANIIVKGTNKGTSTNAKGEFILKDVDENSVLIITSIGYNGQEISAKNNEFISLRLKVAVGNLDELQVIAYGTTTKRYNTGNVSTVKATDIEKQPVNNPLLALQGRVPGLVVTQNTGVPGGGIIVRIQGQNSMTKGNDPLYVIDGVPINSQVPSTGLGGGILRNSGSYISGVYAVSGVGNPLAFISPNDIESMTVLKDADATAIYGSRAANGAILITTKKASKGAAKVDINVQNGWGQVTRRIDMLNRRQYLDMRYEALKNDGININTILATNGSYSDLKVWDTTRYTDWQKVLIGGTSQYTNINGSVSGGTDNFQYLVRGTYHKETTVFPGDFADEKASMHFNINSFSANRKFHFQFSGNYLVDNNQLPNTDLTNLAILLEPIAPSMYNADGSLNWMPNLSDRSTFNVNPMAALMNTYRNRTNNLVSNAIVGYRILKNLDLKTSFGYTRMQGNEFVGFPMAAIRPEDRPFSLRNARYGYKEVSSWIIEPQLNYNRQIAGGNLNILTGSTIQQYRDNGFQIAGEGYSNDNILENITAATRIIPGGQLFSEYKYAAVFGRVNYNWRNKYIISFNTRRDGSSRFGEKNRFHNFSSIGAAWIFSDEEFIQKKMRFISFGKLRASYGTTGSDQIGEYSFMNLYGNVGAGVPYQGAIGLVPLGAKNPYIEWEKTQKLSVGADLGFWHDRILFNATYAYNKSSNQLLSLFFSSIVGFDQIATNFPGTVRNTNWEFSVTSNNFISQNFTWTSNINLTIPENKLVAFPGIENTTYNSRFFVGQSLSVQPVWYFMGVDPATGLYLAADIHGNPTSNPDYNKERNTLINTAPKFYGGVENSFQYKGLQLSFIFQYVKQRGQSFIYYNGYSAPGRFYQGTSNQPISVLNRWQKPGDVASVQKYSTSLYADVAVLSDAGFTDASYMRLKNLSLSYELPKKWMERIRLRSCRFYTQAQNLLTITNYKGADPENQSLTALPPLRVWTVGIQLGL